MEAEARDPIGEGAGAERGVGGHAERDDRAGDGSSPGGIGHAWQDLVAQALAVAEPSTAKDDALTELVAHACDLLATNCGVVFLYNATRELKCRVGYGLSSKLISQIEELSRPQAARRLLAPQSTPHIVEDVHSAAAADAGGRPVLALLAREGIATLASFPLAASGNLLGFIAFYHSKRRVYTKEELDILVLLSDALVLALLNRQLAESRQVADKGRDHFISALSHELRTPLTSIIGFTQMIRRRLASAPPSDGRMAAQMDIIWTQAQRLNRLIDTFVDIANIEQGSFTVKSGRVELITVLKSAIEQSVARLNPACKVEMSLPDGPVWVRGDTLRLEQVFAHVVSNALRYSPLEYPVVITCAVNDLRSQVEASVADQGPGISADLRDAIFERFYQADALRSGGLGVGLYLTKTIVEAHGGQIRVESGLGEGTRVSIALPL